ncbi:hypothetical protein AX16_002284 [Volvariella volvacea WC 439]|nr:hypothetical protein AX16_002284 [Volvariella volvacea WC 439]
MSHPTLNRYCPNHDYPFNNAMVDRLNGQKCLTRVNAPPQSMCSSSAASRENFVDVPWGEDIPRHGAAVLVASFYYACAFMESVDSNLPAFMKNIRSEKLIRNAMEVASKWTASSHMEIDDLRKTKLFDMQWKLQAGIMLFPSNIDVEKIILPDGSPRAILMSRTATVIAYCTLPLAGDQHLHIVFNPRHSSDARVYFTTSFQRIATYIQDVFHLNQVVEGGVQWEEVDQFWLHTLARKPTDPADIVRSTLELLIKANGPPKDTKEDQDRAHLSRIRDLKARLSDMEVGLQNRDEELEKLKIENARMEGELNEAHRELRAAIQPAPSAPHPALPPSTQVGYPFRVGAEAANNQIDNRQVASPKSSISSASSSSSSAISEEADDEPETPLDDLDRLGQTSPANWASPMNWGIKMSGGVGQDYETQYRYRRERRTTHEVRMNHRTFSRPRGCIIDIKYDNEC